MSDRDRVDRIALSPDEQLRRWLNGDPQCPNTRNECCPDFSCCRPVLMMSRSAREAFVNGTDEQRFALMMQALGALMEGRDVHIIGSTDHEH